MKIFKQFLAISFVSFFAMIMPAHAQIPTTDIANLIKQGLIYAQQIEQYTRQGLQLEAELKNLTQNPTSILGTDVGRLINGVGSVMSATNSIGGDFAQIDRNFATTFNSPTTATLAESFTKWNSTSTGTLEGALKAAGMHRDEFATDTDALTALYDESQASDGNLKAIQSLAKINSMQVQQTQKLQDLIATQNIASNTYMMSQASMQRAAMTNNDDIQKGFAATKLTEIPTLDTSTKTYKKLNLYTPK